MGQNLFIQNALSPPILFFFLGAIAYSLKSDFEIPAPLPKLFSLYLLLAIEDMVQEALNNSRKAYVAGATGRVKDRLAKFGVDVIGSRKDALTAAIDNLNE